MSKPKTSMIRNWTIKRSGARMTIMGTDATGAAVKVSADDISAPKPGAVIFPTATDKKTGAVYTLVL